MACPLCGELCTCAADRGSSSARGSGEIAPHVAVLIDPESLEASEASEQCFEASLEPAAEPHPEPASEPSVVEVLLSDVAEVLANQEAAAPVTEAPMAAVAVSDPPAPTSASPSASPSAPAAPFYRPDDSAWRQEVTSRVDNFRTRRKAFVAGA